jgi:Uma2 family endonuclease
MAVGVDVERARRRFTIEEYARMVQTGILTRDERVELIDGEIVEMSPIGNPHAAFVANLTHLLVHAVGDRARVWVQGPVRVPPRSVPQPDLAVLRPRSYVREAATTDDVLLVIEVADTSLRYDRTVKLRLYARAGIPEYWIVDANTETLEIYRSPIGERYADHLRPSGDEHVAPLALPEAALPIASIFV